MQKFDHNVGILRKTPIFSPKIGKNRRKLRSFFSQNSSGRAARQPPMFHGGETFLRTKAFSFSLLSFCVPPFLSGSTLCPCVGRLSVLPSTARLRLPESFPPADVCPTPRLSAEQARLETLRWSFRIQSVNFFSPESPQTIAECHPASRASLAEPNLNCAFVYFLSRPVVVVG
jgi:hypothetical protein